MALLGSYCGPRRADVAAMYCMREYRREQEETSYRVYVTDSLRLRAEGKYVSARWYDIVHPPERVDAGKVISEVVTGAGLEVISHESARPSSQDHVR